MVVRVHIVPTIGRVKLKALNPAHVQSLYRAKLDQRLSPSTVQCVHKTLHKALKQAVRWGLIPCNVSAAVDVPRLSKPEITPLNPGQVKRFLKEPKRTGYRRCTSWLSVLACALANCWGCIGKMLI
jgi:integrase